jgi:hypothetical protein
VGQAKARHSGGCREYHEQATIARRRSRLPVLVMRPNEVDRYPGRAFGQHQWSAGRLQSNPSQKCAHYCNKLAIMLI